MCRIVLESEPVICQCVSDVMSHLYSVEVPVDWGYKKCLMWADWPTN